MKFEKTNSHGTCPVCQSHNSNIASSPASLAALNDPSLIDVNPFSRFYTSNLESKDLDDNSTNNQNHHNQSARHSAFSFLNDLGSSSNTERKSKTKWSNYSKQLSRKLEVYKSLNGDSISVTPSKIKVVNEYEDIKDKHLYLNDSFNHSGRFDIKV